MQIKEGNIIDSTYWKVGIFKADAKRCAEEILSLDEIEPETVLDKARDPNTELHKCFEWNDSKAAEEYRKIQAGQVIRYLVIKSKTEDKGETQYRLLHKTEAKEPYKPITFIVQHEDEYAKMVQRAWNELEVFKKKYQSLSEFEEVFEFIERFKPTD